MGSATMRWPMRSKSISVLGTSFGFSFFLGLFLVAFGRDRRGQFLLEDDGVDMASDRPVEPRHAVLAAQADIGARGEVQVLPILIEIGILRVAHAVGDFRALRRLD